MEDDITGAAALQAHTAASDAEQLEDWFVLFSIQEVLPVAADGRQYLLRHGDVLLTYIGPTPVTLHAALSFLLLFTTLCSICGVYFPLLVLFLDLVRRRCIRNRFVLHRQSVLSPSESPWRMLIEHGDDSSLICCIGFDRASFLHLGICLLIQHHQ